MPIRASLVGLVVAAVVPVVTPASASPVASAPAALHYSAVVASSRTVHLSGISGAIEVTPADDGKVDVTAIVRKGDPALVRVVTNEDASGVAICVLYADEAPETCRPGGDIEHNGSHHEDVDVDLVARIPRGGTLDATMLNGSIRAHVPAGDVRAATMNGSVTVQAGRVRGATTLNGSVDATLESPPTGPRLAFTTNNGSVKLALPAGTDADVSASTMHGSIHANFGMRMDKTGWGGPESGEGRLGRGGTKIEATTMNGSVEVHSGG